ncbi:hypothetical protein RJ639_034830 [Escallonia herrerae]|uniref:Rho termination factor-like N-terminal domain-containing protein n=1 Tax=Escallonia herrerae TaxID=1293975 RepID=A0AA89BAY1_9ASTE|nr:hypothetical protein RJ639_034830 [Escallonia herrerae]
MEAIGVYYAHSVLHLPFLSAISKPKLRKPFSNPKSSDENSSAESVLEVLRQSSKQVRASNKEGGKTWPRRRGLSKGEDIKEYSPVVDQKLSRPPSVFVKRSPIPSAPSQRAVELKSEASPVTANKELGAEELEEMKLPALKELAKSRGMKGYSKLKKGELVELLRS